MKVKLGRINIYSMMRSGDTLTISECEFNNGNVHTQESNKIKFEEDNIEKFPDKYFRNIPTIVDGFYARFWDLKTFKARELCYFVKDGQCWLSIDSKVLPFHQYGLIRLKSAQGTFKFSAIHNERETTYTALRTGILNMFVDSWFVDDEITSIALLVNILCTDDLRERYTKQIMEKKLDWHQLIFNSQQVYAPVKPSSNWFR